MRELFRRHTFAGFGPCPLAGEEPALFTGKGHRPGRLRALVRREVPRSPGVYGMIDAVGQLIYVGKARSLRLRLMSYFRPSREEKAGKIVAETRKLVWEPQPGEFAALLRELWLIRRWKPRWNVQYQPRRQRRVYLCMGRPPAAHAFTAVKPPGTARLCFGPFLGARRTREAVDRLNDWFRLRDCPQKQAMRFADQGELFPLAQVPGCLRHEIGNCLAPCAAACTQSEYAFHAAATVDFLQGRDGSPLEILQRQMEEASARLEFERAGALRDRLEPLQWLWKHLGRLREARQVSGVYPADGAWHVVKHGVVRARLPQGEAEAALRLLRAGPATPPPTSVDEVDGLLLVSGWFRKHQAEREKVLGAEALEGFRAGLQLDRNRAATS